MASLKVGFDLFAGSSQAGTDSSVPGVFQVETAKAEPYKVRIQELDSNEYYDAVTRAYQAGATTPAEELTVPGSNVANPSAIRRLSFRLPAEAVAGIGAAGATLTFYAATTDSVSSGQEAITITFQP